MEYFVAKFSLTMKGKSSNIKAGTNKEAKGVSMLHLIYFILIFFSIRKIVQKIFQKQILKKIQK